MIKKVCIIPLIIAMILSSVILSNAISTRSIAALNTVTELSISSKGNAELKADIEADKTLVDKVSISMTLEKKSGSRWSSVKTWNVSENSYRLSTSKSLKVTKGETYRTKATYTMYKNGKMIEKITDYGSEVSY